MLSKLPIDMFNTVLNFFPSEDFSSIFILRRTAKSVKEKVEQSEKFQKLTKPTERYTTKFFSPPDKYSHKLAFFLYQEAGILFEKGDKIAANQACLVADTLMLKLQAEIWPNIFRAAMRLYGYLQCDNSNSRLITYKNPNNERVAFDMEQVAAFIDKAIELFKIYPKQRANYESLQDHIWHVTYRFCNLVAPQFANESIQGDYIKKQRFYNEYRNKLQATTLISNENLLKITAPVPAAASVLVPPQANGKQPASSPPRFGV